MKLEQLIALKKGDKFFYNGYPAEVIEKRYDPKENTGSLFDSPAHLTIYFETNGERIVLSSMWPDPKTLTLPQYSLTN